MGIPGIAAAVCRAFFEHIQVRRASAAVVGAVRVVASLAARMAGAADS